MWCLRRGKHLHFATMEVNVSRFGSRGIASVRPEHSPREFPSARKKSHSKTVMSRSRARCCFPLRREKGESVPPSCLSMAVARNRAKCIGASDTSTPHAGLPSSLMTNEASANRPVTGARRALKTWRMTRSREPNFYRLERTLQRIRSASGVKVRAGGLLLWPLHVFPMPLSQSLCQAAACHQLTRSCLIPSSS